MAPEQWGQCSPECWMDVVRLANPLEVFGVKKWPTVVSHHCHDMEFEATRRHFCEGVPCVRFVLSGQASRSQRAPRLG